MGFKQLLFNYALALFNWEAREKKTKFIRPLVSQIFVNKRRTLKLNQYQDLAQPIDLAMFAQLTAEVYGDNDWYSHALNLKRYAHYPLNQPVCAGIEHGNAIDPKLLQANLNPIPYSYIITFAKKRALMLQEKTGKESIAIGPYIHYASDLLSAKQLQNEKKRLGYSLLVIPSHSTMITHPEYDVSKFCQAIKKISKDYHSVRICLYWQDVLRNLGQIYERYGFECVCAGHIFDPFFLNRLKSIINLADVTCSNAVSTHVGYCLYLHKPFFLLNDQDVTFQGEKKEVKLINTFEQLLVVKRIKKLFRQKTSQILPDQWELIAQEWGFSEIKSAAEMKALLNKFQQTVSRH